MYKMLYKGGGDKKYLGNRYVICEYSLNKTGLPIVRPNTTYTYTLVFLSKIKVLKDIYIVSVVFLLIQCMISKFKCSLLKPWV